MSKEKVCVIGSGNWGSVIAKIIGNNVMKHTEFDNTVKMWVHEEIVNGRNLSEIINETKENVKYLPGIKLPNNLLAEPDLLKAAQDATILVFVVPHQFLKGVCEKLVPLINTQCKAVSLIKGVEIDENGLHLISDIIKSILRIDVSVLCGANIASEIALEKFSESTLGYTNPENARLFQKLFSTRYFHIECINDVAGVEVCGALKNIVAIAAGVCDGLECGENTKAAVIRLGLKEMKKVANFCFTGIHSETFLGSCGIADLIATCYGGRNKKIAQEHVKSGKSFSQLEKEMMNGQKLQGTLTAESVYKLLIQKQENLDDFPIMCSVYEIVYNHKPPQILIEKLCISKAL